MGSIADFQNVVKRIPGMEWLGDFDTDIATPDPGFLVDGSTETGISGRLFVVVGTRQAYAELLRLWRAWVRSPDEKLRRNFGALAEVFKHLQDAREWGPVDRVQSTGVVAFWEQGLSSNEPTIRFEAELWCRIDQAARQAGYDRLQGVVAAAGGQCIAQAAIPEIDYHGVLIELPASAVKQTIDAIKSDGAADILRVRDVKYFAPLANVRPGSPLEGTSTALSEKPLPKGDPIAALLDGLPLSNHLALADRLLIDDPDGFATGYQPTERRHGTAMASLIVHGELDSGGPALGSRLYVRPVMRPGSADMNGVRWEELPADQLSVDLVHRAIKRALEGDSGHKAEAPKVKIINLSLGDTAQPFDRQMSPWARLLDWLAWRYQVLFVVSAGNHLQDLVLPAPPSSVAGMSDDDLRAHTLRAMVQQRVFRRLLAPAESVNALTVGALHSQSGAVGQTGQLVDLFRGAPLPSPISPVGGGFRRSIKPEILVPGGRRFFASKLQGSGATSAEFALSKASAQPGQQVASPGGNAIPPSHTVRTSGTSNAAALTTRRAIQFAEQLAELRSENGGEMLRDEFTAVLLKAMLVHGASWANWHDFFNRAFDGPDSGMDRWWRIKKACSQLLGYGAADFDRGSVCTDQRAIVLGCGTLRAEEGHVFQVPLPPAMNAQKVLRRLTITLAWLTPVSPRHRNYCMSDLWFDPPVAPLRVSRINVADKMVKQGTVQHEVLEGESAVPITPGDTMGVQVNCRADAGGKLEKPIPYALLVSLETAEPLAVSIYEQVKIALDQLRAPVPVHAPAAVSTPAREE